MHPAQPQKVLFTRQQLVRELRKHKYPITVKVAGAGVTETIRSTFDIARAGRRILRTAAACEGGFVIC